MKNAPKQEQDPMSILNVENKRNKKLSELDKVALNMVFKPVPSEDY